MVRGVCELAALEAPDVQYPDHTVARDQRDAEQGPDSPPAQERLDRAFVVDVRQPHVHGHAARVEPAIDREAMAFGNVHHVGVGRALSGCSRSCSPGINGGLFQPEQEDRARVDVEDERTRAAGQQLVQLEIGGAASVTICTRSSRPRASRPPRRGCVIDRQCGTVGDELEEVDVVLHELAWSEAADVQHADRHALDEERHSEQGLDALLPQQRIQHVGVIDIRKMQRAPLCGNAAREALPERDADSALDLFLEADGRAGNELVGLLVEQQDRRGVDLEDGTDLVQQLREQIGQVEMREGRIVDCLQPQDVLGVPRANTREG